MEIKTIRIIDYYLGNLLIAILKPVVILLGILLRRDHGLELKKDITIIKMLGGGSLVIAFPALLGLRRKYPGLSINLVTMKGITPFARSLNIFDNIIEIDDSGIFKFFRSSLGTWIKIFRNDTIIDLEVYSRLSTVFSALTCARNRIGFYLEEAFWRRRLHTHLVYFNRFSGSYYFYDKIFQLFSISPCSTVDCKEHLSGFLPATEKTGKYRICIGHACSGLSLERMLDAGQWEKVFISRIDKSFEAEVIFLGAQKDSGLASEITERLSPGFINIKFTDLCGKTDLNKSLSILSSSDEFWGIDSSLLHYARLFKIGSSGFMVGFFITY
ncbi:MAG TPA: lipopolysaccharide heptosyltransferase family protein [Nitrospirae bacterium]|nr:lipopolysaccharide heptosyltransferase family protein [Nitrospirota bacterium]